MKKYKTVAVIVSVCLIIAFGFVAFKTNLFKMSAGSTSEAGVSSYPSINLDELSEEQRKELRKMELWGDAHIFEFKIAKYLGLADDNFTRMTLQEAKQLVEENKRKGLKGIADAFYERQPYADAISGCNNIVSEYWLDDEGTEGISISWTFDRVNYFNRNIKVGTGTYVERLYTE